MYVSMSNRIHMSFKKFIREILEIQERSHSQECTSSTRGAPKSVDVELGVATCESTHPP